jgi:hypothetical protein
MLDESRGGSAGHLVELQRGLNDEPEQVEIGEVDHPAVGVGAPVPVDHARQEEARYEEEIGHAEGLREGDDPVHEALAAHRLSDAEGRVHHHHEEDADALGGIDPGDAAVVEAVGELKGLSHGLDASRTACLRTGRFRFAAKRPRPSLPLCRNRKATIGPVLNHSGDKPDENACRADAVKPAIAGRASRKVFESL